MGAPSLACKAKCSGRFLALKEIQYDFNFKVVSIKSLQIQIILGAIEDSVKDSYNIPY